MSNTEQNYPSLELATNPELATLPQLDFEAYRQLYDDETNAFREMGILENEAYSAAITDERTQWATFGNIRLPYLVSIEHVPGYDASRCRQLTSTEDTLFLCIPVTVLHEAQLENLNPGKDIAIVIESQEPDIEKVDQNYSKLKFGNKFHVEDFLDTEIAEITDQPASMSIYEADLVPVPSVQHGKPAATMKEAWQTYVSDLEKSGKKLDIEDGAALLTAEELKDNPELLTKLWSICESRFSEMGEFHPVSMEESKEFFDTMLTAKDSSTVIKYDNGEPVCFGFFSFGLDECEWLSNDFKKRVTEDAKLSGHDIFYYPEIVRKHGKDGQALAVIELQSALLAKMRKPLKLLFETSNRSGQYVPYIVEKYVAGTGNLMLSAPIERTDRIYYRYLAN